MRGVMSREHLREVTPDFRFHTDPEIRKDVQATAEEALAWEVLQVNALLRLLNLLLLNLRLQDDLKAHRCPRAVLYWRLEPSAHY